MLFYTVTAPCRRNLGSSSSEHRDLYRYCRISTRYCDISNAIFEEGGDTPTIMTDKVVPELCLTAPMPSCLPACSPAVSGLLAKNTSSSSNSEEDVHTAVQPSMTTRSSSSNKSSKGCVPVLVNGCVFLPSKARASSNVYLSISKTLYLDKQACSSTTLWCPPVHSFFHCPFSLLLEASLHISLVYRPCNHNVQTTRTRSYGRTTVAE